MYSNYFSSRQHISHSRTPPKCSTSTHKLLKEFVLSPDEVKYKREIQEHLKRRPWENNPACWCLSWCWVVPAEPCACAQEREGRVGAAVPREGWREEAPSLNTSRGDNTEEASPTSTFSASLRSCSYTWGTGNTTGVLSRTQL